MEIEATPIYYTSYGAILLPGELGDAYFDFYTGLGKPPVPEPIVDTPDQALGEFYIRLGVDTTALQGYNYRVINQIIRRVIPEYVPRPRPLELQDIQIER